MRFYRDFPEAINEVRRDLKEMGILIQNKSVQNMDISNNIEYQFYELQNYTYTITNPDFNSIELKNPEWAKAEFTERTVGHSNPGEAWKLRREYWEPFLNKNGQFDYAYPDRLEGPLHEAIEAFKKDINTRRGFIGVFSPIEDCSHLFQFRIPCTIGYWLNYRQGKMNLTYLQRSSDFSEHFNYDIYLADRLKHFVAEQVGVEPGNFTHWIGSLHVFWKDVAHVF